MIRRIGWVVPALTCAVELTACGADNAEQPVGGRDAGGVPTLDGAAPDRGSDADAGQTPAPPRGALVEELGLWFPEAQVAQGPAPEPTNAAGQPTVLSASIEVRPDGTGALIVEVEGTFASASVHLLVGGTHLVFPVRMDRAEYENIVPMTDVYTQGGYQNAWRLDDCLESSDPGCFAQCVQACSAPVQCSQWLCMYTPYLDRHPEQTIDAACVAALRSGTTPTADHAPGLDREFYKNECTRSCSLVVGMLHYYDAGQLRFASDSPTTVQEYAGFTSKLHNVLSLAGSPEGFATSLPQRRAARDYCPFVTEESGWDSFWGFSSEKLALHLEDSACESSEKLRKYWSCMVTGELPEVPATPPASPSVPKRRRRISSPCSMFKNLPTQFPPATIMSQFDPLPGSPVASGAPTADGLEGATIDTPSTPPDWQTPF